MDWETARRWLEIMAKNGFDPNQPAYIVVLQRVEELEAALKLGAEAYVAALPDASTDAMTDLTIERNALRHENERLRADVVYEQERNQNNVTAHEAEIERLREEVLRTEEMRQQNAEYLEKAEASVRTLEAALRIMYDEWMDQGHNDPSAPLLCMHSEMAERMARAALEETTERIRAEASVRTLEEALRRIQRWEMPPVVDREGKPSTYSMEYRSNGERDFIRGVARAALREEGE